MAKETLVVNSIVEEGGKKYHESVIGEKKVRTRVYESGDSVGGYQTRWVSKEANLFVVSSPSGKVVHLARRVPDVTFQKFGSVEEAVFVGKLLEKAPEKDRLAAIWLFEEVNGIPHRKA